MKGWGFSAVVVVLLVGCSHENSITGPYDQSVADAGHGVAAAGSGTAAAPAPTSSTSGGRRRGAVSVPGQTATANGVVVSKDASSMLVHRANGDDVTVQVSSASVIRLHGKVITFADVAAGNRVEARGTRVDDHTITGLAIEVEDDATDDNGDKGDDGNPGHHVGATANGTVASVGASSLVVHAANGVDTTVNVDANTKIKKHGDTITLAGIAAGDQVETRGTRVDAHTILAEQIEVEDASGHGNH